MASQVSFIPWKPGRVVIPREDFRRNPYNNQAYAAVNPTQMLGMTLQVQRWASASDDAIKNSMKE